MQFGSFLKGAVLGGAISVPAFAADDVRLPASPDSISPPPRSAPETPGPETTLQPKVWGVPEVHQELGAIKLVIQQVDNQFKATPNDARGANWQSARTRLLDYIAFVERDISDSPSSVKLKAYGLALESQRTVLTALYPAQPAPSAAAAPGAITHLPGMDFPTVGFVDAQQFINLKGMTTLYAPRVREYFTRDGRTPDASEAAILEGIGIIESSKNPAELTERLVPLVDRLLNAVTDLESSGVLMEGGPLKEIKERLSSLKLRRPAGTPAPAAGEDLDWHRDWLRLVAEDKVPHLHPGSKAYHDRLKFNALVGRKEGFDTVIEDATTLLNYLDERGRAPQFASDELANRLIVTLRAITSSSGADQLPTNSFQTMQQATEIYLKRPK